MRVTSIQFWKVGWGRRCYNSAHTHPAPVHTHRLGKTFVYQQVEEEAVSQSQSPGQGVQEKPTLWSSPPPSACKKKIVFSPILRSPSSPLCHWPFLPLLPWGLPVMSNSIATPCSLPGSSVHGILQAGIVVYAAIPFSRGSC